MMQPRTSPKKSSDRLIVGLLMVAMGIFAAVAIFMYLAYQRAASALVVERDQQVALLSAARLKDELSNYADVLSGLARTPEIYGDDEARQRVTLQRASFRLAVFDSGTVLLDNFGVVRATEPIRPALLGQDWSDQPFFQELLSSAEMAISNGVDYGPRGSLVAIISVPVLNERGEFVGALAGMFGLGESTVSSFYASIVRLRIGQSGTTYVVDSNSRILYDSNSAHVGAMLDPQSFPAGALEGVSGAERTQDAEGHDIVAAFAPVPGTGWTLITEDDWATLTRSTQRYARTLLALLVLGPVLPALGLGLLLRQRRTEAREQEQLFHEMQMTNTVQEMLLPQYVPLLPGYLLTVYHQPARTARGDFYDYQILPDGRLMLTLGDVADGSMRAALVTATTRAALRGAAHLMLSPSGALEYGNDLLCPEMQPGQAVTCLYAILDPADGRLAFASAGHGVAYYCGNGHSGELQPTGGALGLAPGAQYQDGAVMLAPGECVIFCTGGLFQARNAQGDGFGLARLQKIVENGAGCGQDMMDVLTSELEAFTGSAWVQEDDITLLALMRVAEDESA
jgi:serine phosphatase RsbU (regulator of sigma subunit)